MPEDLRIVWVLALGLSYACACGYIAYRLNISPILGYLFAGYLIGPNSPGFIADQALSNQLANIGVTLLMFAVGLNFKWKELIAFKKTVIPGALFLSLFCLFSGFFFSQWIGETKGSSLVIGLALSVSSTVIIVRMLTDQKLLHSPQAHLIIGWTIIEDLVSIFGLIILPAVYTFLNSGSSQEFSLIFYLISLVFFKLFILSSLIYFFGEWLLVKILKVIARTKSHELFTLAVLASVFLIAVASSLFFDISIALGAFIAGTIIGKTELSHQAAANALPTKDAFSVIFFLSVGMLLNPFVIPNHPSLFLGILTILLLFRPLIAFCILKIAKYPLQTSLTMALAVSQIGEYSFIISEEGSHLNILSSDAHDMIIACSVISIALNPLFLYLFKKWLHPSKKISPKALKTLFKKTIYSQDPTPNLASSLPKALVIGYGLVGKMTARSLAKRYQVVVIDQNVDNADQPSKKNIQIIFGDATQPQLLEGIDLGSIRLLIITTSNVITNEAVITLIKNANPHVEIISRIHFQSEYKQIKFKNIPVICDEEAVGEKMVALIHSLKA